MSVLDVAIRLSREQLTSARARVELLDEEIEQMFKSRNAQQTEIERMEEYLYNACQAKLHFTEKGGRQKPAPPPRGDKRSSHQGGQEKDH